MTNKKVQRQLTPDGRHGQGSDRFVKEIIKALERISYYSGANPATVFRDWLALVDATLEALPAQVKHVARHGRFGPDTPATAELFERVRRQYQLGNDPARQQKVWTEGFATAFGLLLESSALGLHQGGYMGPDVIGHVYSMWASRDPSNLCQYFTPAAVGRLMAGIAIPNGEREVYDRLKQALLHPDNLLGQAVVLASIVVEAGQPAREYFFNTAIPAALNFYQPILFHEPAIGSGTLMLSAAAQFPDWANYYGLVRYSGGDVDLDCITMARINEKLYALNGFGLKLAVALAEGLAERDQKPVTVAPGPPATLLAKAAELHKNGKNGSSPPEELPGADQPSFEALFRTQPGTSDATLISSLIKAVETA